MHNIPAHRTAPHSLPPTNDRDFLFPEEESANLRDYWVVIRKYCWTIALFWLPVVLMAVLSVQGEEPTYTATATLYIENQTPNIMGVMGVSSALTPTGNALDYYVTQRRLLTSRSLAASVIQELGLDRGPRLDTYMEAPTSWIQNYVSIGFLRARVQGLAQWLLERIKGRSKEGQAVEAPAEEQTQTFEFGVHPGFIDSYLSGLIINNVPQTQMIGVSFTSLNPAFSKEVANAHATAFIRNSLLTRFELTTEARQFLADRLAELKTALEKSEEELNRFQKTHAVMPLEKGENLVAERLRGLNADLTQARSKRIELESLYRMLQQRDSRFLSQIIDNPVVRQIKDQIATLEV
jgi:succinoglycan biosynthesis transport protein ExoP